MSEATQDAVADAHQLNDGSPTKIAKSEVVRAQFCFTLQELQNFLKTARKMVANVDAGQKPGRGHYEIFETSGPATGPRGKRGIRLHDKESNESKGFVST